MRELVEPEHPSLSICRQCQLLGLPRSSYYYEPACESEENLRLMRLIDEHYLKHPSKGSRRMTVWLRDDLHQEVNRKRVQRLMQVMGLEAVYPKPNLSAAAARHKVYPYLLRDCKIERPDQVWSTDITYIPMAHGFMFLAATIDWFSRYVISWRLSNTLDGQFCLDMLEEALGQGKPEIFNTDQGTQFTAQAWTSRVEADWSEGEHGWQGPLPGQRVRGEAVADGQARTHLPVSLREGAAVACWPGAVLPLLQRGETAPRAGLPEAS